MGIIFCGEELEYREITVTNELAGAFINFWFFSNPYRKSLILPLPPTPVYQFFEIIYLPRQPK